MSDGLDTVLDLSETGLQQGVWALQAFHFGEDEVIEGSYIESKPGKTLVLSIDDASEGELRGFIDRFIKDECGGLSFIGHIRGSMSIKKFTVTIKDKKDSVTAMINMQLDANYMQLDANYAAPFGFVKKKIKLKVISKNLTGSDMGATGGF